MSKTPIMDWIEDHLGWFVLGGVSLLILIIVTSFYIYDSNAKDSRVYEDNQIICYSDNSETDKPNSRQDMYCLRRDSKVKTCEYDWSRGSGNKPPQGCYL